MAIPLGIIYFNESTSMALACFDTVDASIRIITTFHNYNILGRYLKIAFAKYKLNMICPSIISELQSKSLENYISTKSNINNKMAQNNQANSFFPKQKNLHLNGNAQEFNYNENIIQDNSNESNSNSARCNYLNSNSSPSRKISGNSDFTMDNNQTPNIGSQNMLSGFNVVRHKMSDVTAEVQQSNGNNLIYSHSSHHSFIEGSSFNNNNRSHLVNYEMSLGNQKNILNSQEYNVYNTSNSNKLRKGSRDNLYESFAIDEERDGGICIKE